jgi:chitin disaccharide deacetylase
VRRLIINADDFGLTTGINRAILKAHCDGVVSSATLMANAPAFDDAIHMTKTTPRLSVGCHIVLVDGSPLSDASRITSLTQSAHSSRPRFSDRLGMFFAAALSGRIAPAQVELEVAAQIAKLQSVGLAVTHIDTHKHTHMIPMVWRSVLRAAKACGVPALRNPFSPPHFLDLRLLKRRPQLWQRYLQVSLLRGLNRRFRQDVRDATLFTPDGSFGLVETGHLDQELFLAALENIPEGTWEFVCHPGYCDAELDAIKTRLRDSRTRELEVLTSLSARETLSRKGIALISYRDLSNASTLSPTY